MTFALLVCKMGFTTVKLVKTRNLHPELDAAIQFFASNLTEDDVALNRV